MQTWHTVLRNISLYLVVVYGLIFFWGGGYAPLSAQQQWVRALDQDAFTMVSEGNTVFAYSWRPDHPITPNLYRSLDGGNTWSLMPQSPQGYITSMYINGSSVYALGETLWRSQDNGQTWESITYNTATATRRTASRNSGGRSIGSYTITGDGSTLYIAADKLYRSKDGGTTWQVKNSGIPSSSGYIVSPYGISINGSSIFLATILGVYYSTDEAENWSLLTPYESGTTPPNINFRGVLARPSCTLAYTINGKIWRTTTPTNSASWQTVFALPFDVIGTLVEGNGIVFLVTQYNGVYYSNDEGLTWRFLQGSADRPVFQEIYSLTATDTDVLVGVPCYFTTTATRCHGAYKLGYSTLPPSFQPFTLSGNAGTPNALITLTSNIGNTLTTTASASGDYTFSGLTEGAYTLVPTLANHVFTPTNASVSISGGNQSGVNFTARAGAPAAPVGSLTFSVPAQPLGSTSLTLSWNPPAGGAAGYTIVLQESPTPPTGTPDEGDVFTGDPAFNGMTMPPFSGQVVFNGSGTSVTVTGLTPNTRYSAVAYPYNGSGGARSYFTATPATASTQTLDVAPPPVSVTFGSITLTPATLNFGDVARNTSYTRTYSLRYANLTTAAITLTPPPQWALSIGNAPFSTAPIVWTTQANVGQISIRARFTPTTNGTFSGEIQHSAGSTQASARVGGQSSPPSITISTLTLRFGTVVPGTSEIRAYRVSYRNLLTPVITLTPPPGFTISTTTTGTFTAQSLTVSTRTTGSFVVYVQFSPTAVGKYTARLQNDTPDLPAIDLEVRGEALFPTVSLAPSNLDFGDVPINSCKVLKYTIRPSFSTVSQVVDICPPASGAVQISRIGANGPFTTTCLSVLFTRSTSRTADVWVRYCPTDESALGGYITHTSEPGGQEERLELYGFGARPELTITPSPTNYGSVNLASARTGVLRVRYDFLTLPATITLSSTATHPFAFEQSAGNYQARFTTSATATSGTFSVNVRFEPTADGRVVSTFAGVCVAANGTTTDTFTLTGTGVGASITANSNQTLAFGNQFVLTPNTRSFPLVYRNITTGTITIPPSNHPEFLLMDPQTGVFSTTAVITLNVGGTPANPVSSTATLFARFLPTGGGGNTLTLNIVSANVGNSTSASARLSLSGTGLAPMVNVTRGTVAFGRVNLGETRYFGYSMTYRNITAATITIPIPVGSDFSLTQVSSGTWTTAGQTLTIPTVQPPTTATTEVQLWLRFTPSVAQSTSVTLRHTADGGDPRTVDSDNLVLVATKPSLFAVRAVFAGVPAQIRACEALPPFTVTLFDASGTPTNWWLDANGQPTYLAQGDNNLALRFVRTGGAENGTIAYSTSGNTITSTGQIVRVTGNYTLSLAANNSSIVTTTGNRTFSVIAGTPSITSFTPQTTSGSCSAGFLQMSIFGCSFAPDSRLRIGGLELVPFIVNSTMIVVRVPARLIGLNLKKENPNSPSVSNQYPFVVTSATLRQAATSSVPLQLTISAATTQFLAFQAPSLGKGGASLQSANDPQASVKINVYFLSGLVKTSGQPTQVQLPSVSGILNELGITSTFSAQFPNFAESDTVITTWQGARVKQPNLTNQMSITVDTALARPLMQRLQALPEVLFAEREFGGAPTAVPNDPLFATTSPVRTSALNGLYIQLPMDNGDGVLHGGGNLHGQWYLGAQPNFGAHIRAIDAWDIYTGSIRDTIGIIELTGLDKNHPDLIDKVVEFTPAVVRPTSTRLDEQIRDKSHGMWVSSVAAAQGNNSIGVAGVNHHARIVNGNPEELRNIVKRHPQMTILNHSYSGTSFFPSNQEAKNIAITNRSNFTFAYNSDILSVGSSGNNNNLDITYPAGFGHTVFVVGGTDEYDRRASERNGGSNYGSLLDIVAPFSRILVATPALTSELICPTFATLSLYQVHKEAANNAFYAIVEGTSFSAPQVSGVASLMVGYARDFKTEDNSSLPLRLHADDVRNLLILSADQIRPDLYLYGARDKGSLSNFYGGKPSDEVGKSWNREVGYGRLNAHRALNLVDKGKLFHVTTGTYSGVFASSTATTEVFLANIYGVHGVQDGERWIRCFTVEYNVDFPTATKQYAANNNRTPYVWGNGSLMSDYGITREELISYPLVLSNLLQTGVGWCEPVAGTITRTGVTLKTFVYQLYQDAQTPTDTWFPVRWDAVKFAYSAFFPPPTTIALALEKGGGAHVTAQAVPKPFAENATQSANNLVVSVGSAFLTNVTAAPNPLSGQTTISYTALGQCRISLTLLDIYAQPVAEILRNVQHSEGVFSLPCDIAHLASGSYTARIQAITPDGHAHTQFIRLQLVK